MKNLLLSKVQDCSSFQKKAISLICVVLLMCLLLINWGDKAAAGPVTSTFTPTQVPPPIIEPTLEGAVTNKDRPIISGKSVSGATVDIYIDGEYSGSTTADREGIFSFVPPRPLSEGDHRVTAVAKIDNFESEMAEEVTVTVDFTSPDPPRVTNIFSGQRLQSGEIVLEGTAERDSEVVLTYDGQETGKAKVSSTGKFSLKFNLTDGLHNLALTARDKAGNVSKATLLSVEGYTPLTVQKVAEQVSTVSSPVGVVAQLLVLASSFGFTNVAIYLYYLISLLVNFLTRKKPAAWGFVYDAQKKQPIALAIVRIFDAEYKRLLETQVTGADGRFGFMVPEGKYYITVQRTDYKFPSELVAGKVDGFYTDLYHGEIFEVSERGAIVKMNVPNDPLVKRKGFAAFAFGFRTFLRYANLPLFVIVTGLTIYNLFTVRSLLTMVSFVIYVLLFGLMLVSERFKKRSFGIVYDEKTRQALSLAIVRLFDAKDRLMATRVTGEDGRFNLFVKPGRYVLKISREGYADETRPINVSKEFPFAVMDVPMRSKIAK